MASWGFLTSHARVLLCIAHDPGARLRDVAASLGITERSARGIVTDLAEAGYVIKQKDGRRLVRTGELAAGSRTPSCCRRRKAPPWPAWI
jgi:DNA-binding MarR family transcriptional regulator